MMSPHKKKPVVPEVDEHHEELGKAQDAEDVVAQLNTRIANLEGQLAQAEDDRLRALADYQNVQRRVQSERAAWSKLATRELIESLLEPLEHLRMASEQVNDAGLNMVIKQLFARLSEHGLEQVEALGKPFDEATMEAVEGSTPEGKKVIQVISNGFLLNGVLIQPAKVKVG